MDASSAAWDRSGHVAEVAGGAGALGTAIEPDLERLGLDQLRILRRETLEQEADLSYLRRLLHGRMDILRAELDRRPGGPVRAAGPAGAGGADGPPATCWTASRPS